MTQTSSNDPFATRHPGFDYESVSLPPEGAGSMEADAAGTASAPKASLADALPSDVSFDLMATGGHATVCATSPLDARRSDAYQSEAELERAFIEQLQRQAYEYLTFSSEEELIANLRKQLEALNDCRFTDGEWTRFFKTCIASDNDSIETKTQRIQEDHIQVLQRDDGTSKNIRLIDKRNIHNNRLQVINQYTQQGTYENRYDVTILVNGLPLVHVELKRRGVAIKEAFNQIERYQRDSFWSGCGLYEYVQIFVISNGTHTKYYSNTTRESHIQEMRGKRGSKKTSNSFEFTSWWAAADNVPIRDLIPFTKTFFAKHTLLNILTRYCVFDTKRILKVMRPYQIVATERILNRILISENDKSMLGTPRAGGYVWHTTGSGKTLTSFKTARLAAGMEGVGKVMFVVDRQDLDYQTLQEYDNFEKGAVDGSSNTAELARNLSDDSKRILVTTIQKLSCFIKANPKHAIYDKHVVIIFDECHRSQFGKMHIDITKRFKKYHLFGFTGTPIFAENATSGGDPHLRTTEQAFGDKLHTSTIVDAIRDGNVLPFRIDYIQTIDKKDSFPDEKVYGIYRKGAYQDARRVDIIVNYILDHFDQKTKRQFGYKLEDKRVMGFNALFATASIDMAKLYYSAFKRIQAQRSGEPLKVGLIYSFGVNDDDGQGSGLPEETFDVDSLDTSDRDFLEAAMADYNAMFGTSFSTSGSGEDGFQNYYRDMSRRIKERELDLAIVVNMFLTGFDATTLNTLWVDKDLRMHGLIQAFSRTNRILNAVKDFGNIVCFRDLEDEVNEAIALFGDADAQGIVLLKPYAEYLGEYRDRISQLREMLAPGEEPLGEKAEKDFVRLWGVIMRLRNILTTFDEFAEDDELSPYDEQNYRSVYQDLLDKYRPSGADDKIINDDLVFEIELLKQVDINIDYILMLVQKYHDSHCRDKVILADVERALRSSYELRNKRDLIEAFIDSLDHSDDVGADWRAYVAEKRTDELERIIADEKLDEAGTRDLMLRAFRDGGVPEGGTEVTSLMTAKPSRFGGGGAYAAMKQRVIDKLKAFYERFSGLGL